MAFEQILSPRSFNAATDLRTNQFYFVRLDTNGKITTAVAGGDCIGVLQDKPNTGEPGAVCRPGDITKVVAGAALTAGEYVQSDINGKAVSTTTGASSMGQVLEAADGDGSVVTLLFQPSATS